MSITESNDSEVAGPLAYVIHVDESTTEPTRTVLALCTKDDLSISTDESSEDFNPASDRRTRRFRTNNSVDFEVTSAIDVDMEAMDLIGITDENGELTFDSSNRKISPSDDAYIELAYAEDDGLTDITNAELVHRFVDLELTSPEIDPSSTPPVVSWTWWVEGSIHVDYDVSA